MTRVLATVALGLFGLWPAAADESAWAALRENGRVALLRHAATAGGAGDPPGFNLEDCATQRNLTEAGRAQARTLGARFRAEGIWVAKVLTSEWCRCRETGALMEIGLVEPAPTFNNPTACGTRPPCSLAAPGRSLPLGRGPGVLVVVTHGANIRPLTGLDPGEGGIVIVEPEPGSGRV
jgi:hypothetical protein